MKKYFMFFLLFLIFGAAKAQTATNNLHSGYNNITDAGSAYGNMSQTGGTGSWGEFTHTDAFGTTTDVTWSIVGSTLSWSVNVQLTAPTGIYLHLHRLWITDDPFSEDSIVDDDFEDAGPSDLGFGSDHWTSSGSTDLGSSPRTLYFSFENYVGGDASSDESSSETIMGNIYY